MLRPWNKARGLILCDDVTVGDGVLFGPNVLVEEGTRIGEASVIEGGSLLGKVPRLARTSATTAENLPPLRLGVRVTVCAGAVVYAGSVIGDEAIIGDQAQVRERSVIGPRTVIGRGAGDRQRRDDRRAREDPEQGLRDRVQRRRGRRLHRPVRVDDERRHDEPPRPGATRCAARRCAAPAGSAAAPCSSPGVEVGEEAFVAAGAVVTKRRPGPRVHGRRAGAAGPRGARRGAARELALTGRPPGRNRR